MREAAARIFHMSQILRRFDQSGKRAINFLIDFFPMSFCEHCEGQRFDRAQVLRLLRATRKSIPKRTRADEALAMAIKAVRALDLPHLERDDEILDDEIVH